MYKGKREATEHKLFFPTFAKYVLLAVPFLFVFIISLPDTLLCAIDNSEKLSNQTKAVLTIAIDVFLCCLFLVVFALGVVGACLWIVSLDKI